MANEIISKKTRYEFREFLVGWVLREREIEGAYGVPRTEVDTPRVDKPGAGRVEGCS